jgi:hypothetical protein
MSKEVLPLKQTDLVKSYNSKCARWLKSDQSLSDVHHSIRNEIGPTLIIGEIGKVSAGQSPTIEEPTMQVQLKPTMEANTAEVANELTQEELGKVSAGAFNGFLKFGDIKGESTDKDHKDWVTILSFK